MFKKLSTLLLVATMSLSFVACSANNEPNNNTNNQNNVSVEDTENNDEGTAYPLTITDSAGREVTIEEEPESIVSLAPSITEIIGALGREDILVGRTDYCDYPENILDIDSVGSMREPSIEVIIEMSPDVVLTATHTSEETLAQLEDLDITVLYLNSDADFDGTYDAIETVGEIVNANDEAATLIADMNEKVNDIKNKTAAIAEEDRPSVYYVVGFDFTATGDTFISDMIEIAGGDNVAKDAEGWGYNIETLVEQDPEIIISDSDIYDMLLETEGYTELTAIKEGNVYPIDASLLSRQGPRLVEGLEELLSIIHPEL